MADLTPAAEIRAAVKLIRQLADHVPPPPWDASLRDVTTFDGGDIIARTPTTVRARYIASWHPGVALAVADWLEVYAERFAGWTGPHISAELGSALAVARAYLGSKAMPAETITRPGAILPVQVRTARKRHDCDDCHQPIEQGDKYEISVSPPHRVQEYDVDHWLTWRTHYPRHGERGFLAGCTEAAVYREKAEREASSGSKEN